jgi:two-component system phosphate regulon response regulator PhoB
MAERILLVDDEPDLLELVRVNLHQEGYEVETAEAGHEALAMLRRSPPDLVILDLMLPDISGTEICRQVRQDARLASLPIIMLTAKADELDRVVGLELGADDYVTKPFSPRELALRVRAVLRRNTPAQATARALSHGRLAIDPERHRCSVDGEEIVLTANDTHMKRLREKLGTASELIETIRGVGYRFAE